MFAIQWVLDDIMTMYEMGESEIMNVFLYNGDEQYRDETINYLNNNRFVLAAESPHNTGVHLQFMKRGAKWRKLN